MLSVAGIYWFNSVHKLKLGELISCVKAQRVAQILTTMMNSQVSV